MVEDNSQQTIFGGVFDPLDPDLFRADSASSISAAVQPNVPPNDVQVLLVFPRVRLIPKSEIFTNTLSPWIANKILEGFKSL